MQMFQFEEFDRFTGMKYLKEGDLLFFRMNEADVISHVGVYLQNGKFLNSIRSKGVHIDDLNNRYFKTRYYCAARIKPRRVVEESAVN